MRTLTIYSAPSAMGLLLIAFFVSCSSPARNSGLSGGNVNGSENAFANVPTVDYCELVKNPSAYQAKVIRVKGTWFRLSSDIILGDERCETFHPLVAIKFDSSFQHTGRGEADRKLEMIIRGDDEAQKDLGVRVTAVGVLERIPESELKDYGPHLQYRFTVSKVEGLI